MKNIKVLRVVSITSDEVGIHRSMGDLIAASIVPIAVLERIQLCPQQRCHRVQEGLCTCIRVETCSLRTASSLLASYIVTVLVINIHSVKVLATDDIDQISA